MSVILIIHYFITFPIITQKRSGTEFIVPPYKDDSRWEELDISVPSAQCATVNLHCSFKILSFILDSKNHPTNYPSSLPEFTADTRRTSTMLNLSGSKVNYEWRCARGPSTKTFAKKVYKQSKLGDSLGDRVIEERKCSYTYVSSSKVDYEV